LDSLLKDAQFQAVALRRKQNCLTVEASVNDIKSSFLVDTGWSISCIDDRAVGTLQAVSDLGVAPRDPVFRQLDPKVVTIIDHLELGSLEFAQQPLVLKSLKRQGMLEPAVLGGDFLFRRSCLLDCGSGRLYLRETALPAETRMQVAEVLRGKSYAELPLEPAGLFVFACSVEVNGTRTKLLVDTGAALTVLDRGVIDRLQIPRTERRQKTIRGVGKIGGSWLYQTKLESLKAGNVVFTNINVGVADLSRWGIADEPARRGEVKGMLGMDLLRARRAIIDYMNGRLWLKGVSQ
jgi:predicted aspartyl protease